MRILAAIAFHLALGASLAAQAVVFTGDVQADFPADRYMADPGGIDVGVPPALISAGFPISGWDMKGVALSYESSTDTLFVGIDTYVIAGDADGDGDPGGESAPFQLIGGIDWPDFGGSEYFTLAFDFDDDGALDVIAGIPENGDLSDYVCSLYVPTPGSTVSATFEAFGLPVLGCTGPPPTPPSAAWPDLEFTIPNFSVLTAMFGVPGVNDFGLHVFLGSLDDGGLGEDYIPFISASLGQNADCLPVPNHYELVSVTDMGGPQLAKTRLGLLNLYGACVFYSLLQSPFPIPIVELPGLPTLGIGLIGQPGTVGVVDVPIPIVPRPPVSCYDIDLLVPPAVPVGTTIYAQVLSYPLFDVTQTYYTSNVVVYVQP
ncbi:MAG: hypothetical protein R3F20_16105 [Planctomycetota bacterium]